MSYFLNTFPVYFFRGFHCLFSFLSHFYNVQRKWKNVCILLQIGELCLSDAEALRYISCTTIDGSPKISGNSIP